MKPEAARAQAIQWLAEVAKGGDPSGTRQAGRTAPTLAELCHRYMEDHAAGKKKASSRQNDQRLIDKRILPRLGSMKVSALQRRDIAKLHQSLRKTPYEANRVLSLLHKMLTLSERWGMRPDNTNPATNIDRYPEKKRERFLSESELGSLAQALELARQQQTATDASIAAIKLLLLTGGRLSEILKLRWEEVDTDGKRLKLSDSKTGPKTVYLTDAAISVLGQLQAQRDPANPFVIPGRKPREHLVNLEKPWRRIRKVAGLDGVRLHDLRHTYASICTEAGLSLVMTGKLLGHTQPATTARYAHLAHDPAQESAEIVSNIISQRMALEPRP